MSNSKLPSLTAALFVCTPLLAIANLAAANLTECTNGDLLRTVEVVYSHPGQPVPCEVLYDKPNEGTQESLWQASNESGYCEDRAREFVGRLEQMGWSCGASATETPIETPIEKEADDSEVLIGEETEVP